MVSEGKMYCCKAHEPKTTDNDETTRTSQDCAEEPAPQTHRPTRSVSPTPSISSPDPSTSNISIESNASQLIECLEMLGKQVDNLNTRVEILSKMKNKNPRKSSGPRKMTLAGAKQSAKWAFYREHKDNPQVVSTVRGGLVKGSMLVIKKKVIDGNEVNVEIIPWSLKKMYTDIMFDALSVEKQQSYINAALESSQVNQI
jgi:hypothetical protein